MGVSPPNLVQRPWFDGKNQELDQKSALFLYFGMLVLLRTRNPSPHATNSSTRPPTPQPSDLDLPSYPQLGTYTRINRRVEHGFHQVLINESSIDRRGEYVCLHKVRDRKMILSRSRNQFFGSRLRVP